MHEDHAHSRGRRSLGGTPRAHPRVADLDGGRPARTAVPTFKEFKQSTFRDTDGQFIVNGDEPVRNKKALKAYYRSMVGFEQALIVNTVGGVDDRWDATQQNTLTYCVSTKFGADYAAIVNGMSSGAALWEAAANVDFTHVPSPGRELHGAQQHRGVRGRADQDPAVYAGRSSRATPRTAQHPGQRQEHTAERRLWPPANILAHELGHVLGFRHEHTRPEAGTCFEDNNWRALTPYDSASIMHYPQCNGIAERLQHVRHGPSGCGRALRSVILHSRRLASQRQLRGRRTARNGVSSPGVAASARATPRRTGTSRTTTFSAPRPSWPPAWQARAVLEEVLLDDPADDALELEGGADAGPAPEPATRWPRVSAWPRWAYSASAVSTPSDGADHERRRREATSPGRARRSP